MEDRTGRFGVAALVCCGVLATLASIAMAAIILWWIVSERIDPAASGSWAAARGAGAIGLAGLMAALAKRFFLIFGEIQTGRSHVRKFVEEHSEPPAGKAPKLIAEKGERIE